MIEFLIVASFFYILGRTSGKEVSSIKKIKKDLDNIFISPGTGVIQYKDKFETEYINSEEAKADEDRIRLQKDNGIIPDK